MSQASSLCASKHFSNDKPKGRIMKKLSTTVLILLTAILCIGSVSVLADDATWIDVRTQEEWNADHIEGLPLLPHSTIATDIAKLNLDKDTPIKLYCRSGNRAGIAKQTLEELGYSNVENVGTIDDARRARAGSSEH